MVFFDAIDGRTTSIPYIQYYGSVGYYGGIGSGGPLSNFLAEPENSGQACDLNGYNWFEKTVGAYTSVPLTMSVSGALTTQTGMSLSVDISPEIPGIGTSVGSVSGTSTYGWTTSQSNEFTAQAQITTESSPEEFTVACIGSATGGDGITFGVWEL